MPTQLSFEEKLSLMVDRLWTWRQNLALERRLRYAKLKGNACVEDIDYRRLPRSGAHTDPFPRQRLRLGQPRHETHLPCRSYRSRQELAGVRVGAEGLSRRISRALYPRRSAVPRSGPGTRRWQPAQFAGPAQPRGRPWSSMTGPWLPCRNPSGATSGKSAKSVIKHRSTVLTSQVPVVQWHEQIGDATMADGILDRLVHNAHRIELRGESMRKTRARKTESKEEKET